MNRTEPTLHDDRTSGRTATDVQAIIQFKTDSGETCKEVTNLTSISKSGCSFTLENPCEVGRLVKMVTPLPTEYRAYDVDEELYPVIGLVQHCYESGGDGHNSYRLGVAFVGKTFPESYKENPLQNYHICGTTASGLWKITESGKAFKIRNSPRFWISIGINLTFIKKEKHINHKEETITTNISATGASVISGMRVRVGDQIKFASKLHNFYTMAIVRNSRPREDKLRTLHLEFIDGRFPIEKLSVPNVTAVTDQRTDKHPTSSKPGTVASVRLTTN